MTLTRHWVLWRTEASEVTGTATGVTGDSGTGSAEASASICESMSGSLVGAPNIPANGPETETVESTTDESTTDANIGVFKLAIAEHRTLKSIQTERDLFCVKLSIPTCDQSGGNISNT